jgi:hypothetical protein
VQILLPHSAAEKHAGVTIVSKAHHEKHGLTTTDARATAAFPRLAPPPCAAIVMQLQQLFAQGTRL